LSRLELEPNLLFSKVIRSTVFAIGWEMTVHYQIFNVGDGPAAKILVEDPDFVDHAKFFVLKPNSTARADLKPREEVNDNPTILSSGKFSVKSLSPGQNVSYSLTAVAFASSFPPEGGYHQFQPAQISYTKGATAQVGWSSLSHENVVEFISEFQAERLHGSKTMDHIVFVLLIASAILIPFTFWIRHITKYDALQDILDQAKENKKRLKRSEMLNKKFR